MLRAAARSRSPAFDGGSTALLLLIPSLLLTPRCALAQSPSSISAGSSNNSRNYLGTVKFTPSMAVVALMLVTATVFVVVFSLYLLKLFLGVFFTSDSVRIRFAGSASAHSRCSQRLRGLRPEVLETFPTMEYSEVKEQKVTGANECAVCISEFEDDEALRLLPACSHIFHVDCIDAWLDSHTTCPVCRVNLAEAIDVANPVVLDAVEVGFPGPASAEVQIDVPAAGTNGSQQPDHVSIVVEPVSETEEEEDLQHRMEEAMELAELGSRKRELRSGSRRRPPKFPRCHSTGHSLGNQASGERDGRYTLRLPEHVLREILAAKKLHRSASCVAFPNAEDGRSRPGYCYRGAGEGSSGGLGKSTDGRRSSCARSMRGFSHVDEFREDGEGSVKSG